MAGPDGEGHFREQKLIDHISVKTRVELALSGKEIKPTRIVTMINNRFFRVTIRTALSDGLRLTLTMYQELDASTIEAEIIEDASPLTADLEVFLNPDGRIQPGKLTPIETYRIEGGIYAIETTLHHKDNEGEMSTVIRQEARMSVTRWTSYEGLLTVPIGLVKALKLD